jgi:hypothetical protein
MRKDWAQVSLHQVRNHILLLKDQEKKRQFTTENGMCVPLYMASHSFQYSLIIQNHA